jgi:hypothetical protein
MILFCNQSALVIDLLTTQVSKSVLEDWIMIKVSSAVASMVWMKSERFRLILRCLSLLWFEEGGLLKAVSDDKGVIVVHFLFL